LLAAAALLGGGAPPAAPAPGALHKLATALGALLGIGAGARADEVQSAPQLFVQAPVQPAQPALDRDLVWPVGLPDPELDRGVADVIRDAEGPRFPSSWVPVPGAIVSSLGRGARSAGRGLLERIDQLRTRLGLTRLGLLALSIIAPAVVALTIATVQDLLERSGLG